MRPAPTIDRFWRYVDRSAGPDACWPWTGARYPSGYGAFCVETRRSERRRMVTASRFLWEHINGTSAGIKDVCHRCDNPPCCNPAHLFLGTRLENMADAKKKGRTRPGGRPQPAFCPSGHALIGYNAPISAGKRRGCRLCQNARQQVRRLADPEANRQRQHEYYQRRKQREAQALHQPSLI